MCKIMIHSGVSLYFLKNLTVGVVTLGGGGGVNEHKITQNYKNFSLSCFVSQELHINYIMIFGTQVISPDVFLFF